MSSHLEQLIRHMDWADALAWRAVQSLSTPQPDERIRQLLYHVHSVQCAYNQLLRSDTLRIPEPDTFEDLTALMRWGRKCSHSLIEFVSSIDADDLARDIDFPWAEQLVERFGDVHGADIGQSILQVAIHSAYHRGQVNTRIRELDGTPPLTDFIAWVWMGRPAADWPAPDAESADGERAAGSNQ